MLASKPLETSVHVLINATSARLGGGITVLRNLLPALCAEDGGRHHYTVVARPDVRSQLGPGNARVEFATPRLPEPIFGRVVFEQLALPVQALLDKADVLFSPANLATFAAPCPQVLMVQNLAPFDDDVICRSAPRTRLRLKALRELGIASAKAVSRVVFISDYARDRLLPLFGIEAGRSARVHLGRDPAFSPEALQRAPQLRERYGLPEQYLLSVGQFYPYKNIVELVVGFSRALPALPPGLPLVLAGAEHDAEVVQAVRAAIAREGLEGRVRLLGNVPYEDLPPLYAGSAMFIFPSACENFPNILVEGLGSGAPTLCSKLGPMPEVAGDGARYFDPFDPDDLAANLAGLFHDPRQQALLRERGLAKAASYSWEATARGLLEVFDQAAGRS
jgi:glycosyltransferase involved in cell wall biosynthesis